MSYRFKGQKVIINGEEQIITPGPLPSSPANGYIAVDQSDNKLKYWHQSKNRWIVMGDAEDVVFSNSGNGFTATNAQTAIEEAKSTAILKPRYSIVTTFNGTIGNGNWLGYSELIPGDQVPIRIPMNSKLKEITFAYKNALLSSDYVDGTFKLYKNGLVDPTNVIHTETFTNQLAGKNVSGLSLNLASGDTIVGRWTDTGDNPSDMVIVYFFQVE